MNRPLQALLGVAGLAVLLVLGRWILRPAPTPPPSPAPSIAMVPAVMVAGPSRNAVPPLPVKWVELPPETTGVDFVHTWGGGAMDNLVKTSGGGVTLLDYDGDGDLDIYLLQGAIDAVAAPGDPPTVPSVNRLFRNEGNWKFTDATAESGLGDAGFGLGAAAADYDGDGDADLFVANYGRCRLYRNEGGRFVDATAAAGIDLDGFYVGAAWGDADGDGILDLAVCGYVKFDPAAKRGGPRDPFPGPLAYAGESLRLLLGRADGTFEDATKRAGLWSTEGRGMCVVFADLLGSGRPQVVVANDARPNAVYEHRKGTWVDVGFSLGLAYSELGQPRSSMGIAVLDADRDGRPDVVIPDGSGGTLYINLGGRFEDRARLAGLDGVMRGRTGWSALPIDYDLDGWPDLVLTCSALHELQPEKAILFRNRGGGVFEDATEATNFARACCGRGAATGDLDGDGDPDVVIATLGAKPLLLRNDGGEARKSLVVRCVGRGRNRDALGAVVEVETPGLVQREEIGTVQGYLSGGPPEILFGLGASATAARVRVRFPSGAVTELKDVPAGRVVVTE